jgi:hypothetical protein
VSRQAFASDWLTLATLYDDGLAIRTDGTYVRVLEVTPVNPLVMDAPAAERVSASFAQVAARIPDGHALQLCVEAAPLALDRVLALDRAQGEAAALAAEAAGEPERAVAVRRLARAQELSLRTQTAELAAVRLRYFVACPWRPAAGSVADFVKHRRRGPIEIRSSVHDRSVRESARYADGIRSDLEGMDLQARPLDGPEVADLIWRRFAPEAADAGEPPPSRRGLELPYDPATTTEVARADATELGKLLCPDPIDASDPAQLKVGASLEQAAYLASIPDQTWLGWLLHLMQVPRPFALAVHLRATDRYRERAAHRRRYRRLWGLNRGLETRARPVDPEKVQQEEEAASINHELATSAGAGIYDVSVYLSVREPGPDPDGALLHEHVEALGREAVASSDARLRVARGAQRLVWQSTLPLGHDAARRRRKYVSRNVGDTFPLVGTSCGSPSGIPLGYAQPGRTLERLDPFDPAHENHLLVVNGKSGTGKTMTTILLLARVLARGGRGFIVDRAGHFDFLCSLVPGAQSIALGSRESGHAINPWDVPDVERPGNEKIDYLLALHALIVGGRDAGDDHSLDVIEQNQLGLAIRAVYERCALTGEEPREMLLQEELYRRAADEQEAGALELASRLRMLAESLHNYVGEGPYAYLTDRTTTVPNGAPLVAFDTRRVPDDLAGAVLFMIAEHVTSRIERERERFLGSDRPGGEWDGRTFLVIDEAWKLIERRATGRWVNELARRSRHLALFLIAISQQLSDFRNEYGKALLANASMLLLLRQLPEELAYVRDALRLSDEEIHAIASLTTAKRQFSTAFFMNGNRGRGVVSIRVGPLEYWIATNDPNQDEPLRRRALREADGDPWRALRLLASG